MRLHCADLRRSIWVAPSLSILAPALQMTAAFCKTRIGRRLLSTFLTRPPGMGQTCSAKSNVTFTRSSKTRKVSYTLPTWALTMYGSCTVAATRWRSVAGSSVLLDMALDTLSSTTMVRRNPTRLPRDYYFYCLQKPSSMSLESYRTPLLPSMYAKARLTPSRQLKDLHQM